MLNTLQETADHIVVASHKECQVAFLGTKDKPEIDRSSTFKIILSESADAETGVTMRLPKAVPNRIDRLGYIASL